MSHEDPVREVVSILNPLNEARPTVLLGAGGSCLRDAGSPKARRRTADEAAVRD
jgi:hypothetical protein